MTEKICNNKLLDAFFAQKECVHVLGGQRCPRKFCTKTLKVKKKEKNIQKKKETQSN